MARAMVIKAVVGLAIVCMFALSAKQAAQAAPVATPVQQPCPAGPGQLNGAGHLAVVSSQQNNQQSISLMTTSGNPRACLAMLISTAEAQLPSWSPDGKFIAFVLAYSSNGGLSKAFSLYVVSTDGSSAPHAVSDPASGLTYSWSPDSKHLVCSLQGVLMVTDLDGAVAPLFTPKETGDFSPAWSPDGRFIAYSRSDTTNPDRAGGIYVANADGTNAHNVSNSQQTPSTADFYPVWSPDSSQLAFRSKRGGASTEQVYVVKADGTGLTLVSDPKMRSDLDHAISWSPNGQQLAFSAAQAPDQEGYINVVDVTGANLHRLTKNTNHETNPAWSKDGKWIAYQVTIPVQKGQSKQNNVFVTNVSSGDWRNLTTNPLSDASPFWQP